MRASFDLSYTVLKTGTSKDKDTYSGTLYVPNSKFRKGTSIATMRSKRS